MLITKEIEIDMGHRVFNHKSKCRNLHGHRYKIEVGVDDKVIDTKGTSDEGMVIDFSDLKQCMIDNIDSIFDHSFMMSVEDPFYNIFADLRLNQNQKINFVHFVPTAENLAKYWFEILELALESKKIKLHHVRVYETPTSTALYTKYDKEVTKI